MSEVHTFVAQAAAQVTVRPRKLGYLIPGGRADIFRTAVRYAFSEWGGIGQPVVAVLRKDYIRPGPWQFLEVLRPEVLVDYIGISERLRGESSERLGAQVILA